MVEKGDHRPLWDEGEIIDSKHQWNIRNLKESSRRD